MTKRTKLFTEKVWKDGKPARKIVGWENMRDWWELDQTVPEYQDYIGPYYYEYAAERNVEFGIRIDAHTQFDIKKDDILSEKDFKSLVKAMKNAGDRLHKILEDEKKAKRSGTETIEI